MRVHPGAVDPEYRLRHERRVQAVAVGHVLHDEAERADVVRRDQGIVVAEIDFVLARGDLVVRGLDVKAHLLESEHDLTADVFTQVDRRQVEVAARVVRFGRRLAEAGVEKERTRPPARPSW